MFRDAFGCDMRPIAEQMRDPMGFNARIDAMLNPGFRRPILDMECAGHLLDKYNSGRITQEEMAYTAIDQGLFNTVRELINNKA